MTRIGRIFADNILLKISANPFDQRHPRSKNMNKKEQRFQKFRYFQAIIPFLKN